MGWFYNIDVIEACNLRCPSCPQGNMRGTDRPRGVMSAETLGAILDKAQRETPVIEYVGLFSWTEPLLHPDLAALVRAVKSRGLTCFLSSNLNRIERLEEVLRARPDTLRISLSGYHQATYCQSHRGGNIETVKANMRELRRLMDKTHSKMNVLVGYHRYRHNMGEDFALMSAFARELGFTMEPVWAYYMPLEKTLAYHEGRPMPEDQPILDLLAISPDEQKAISQRLPASDCRLRASEMTLNADGSVMLCCSVFDSKNAIATSFLDTPHDELQRRKYTHALCGPCMSHELHKTAIMANMRARDRVGNRNLRAGLSPARQALLAAGDEVGHLQNTAKRLAHRIELAVFPNDR